MLSYPRVITLDAYAPSHRAIAELKSAGTMPHRSNTIQQLLAARLFWAWHGVSSSSAAFASVHGPPNRESVFV
jgi:hypothetical protein